MSPFKVVESKSLLQWIIFVVLFLDFFQNVPENEGN